MTIDAPAGDGVAMDAGAHFSLCRKYRYSLWRGWGDMLTDATPFAMFIGLNPSTADETRDDPTIRRCIAFARSWGYSALCMTNLFAWRDTDPKAMKRAAEPIGPDNDMFICCQAAQAGVVVAAWGNDGAHRGRSGVVRAMLPNLHYLKLNDTGEPQHPLYLKANLTPIPWALPPERGQE